MSLATRLNDLIQRDASIKSVYDFARKSGVSRQTVNLILQGKVLKPNESTIIKIAHYFKISPDAVFDIPYVNAHKAIKFLLMSRGITPEYLSQKTNIGQSTLSDILNNKTKQPTEQTIEYLANYFKVSKEYFNKDDFPDDPE